MTVGDFFCILVFDRISLIVFQLSLHSFHLKIYEEGLHFDDEVKKVGNYMTSISFSAIKRDNILQEL